MKNFDKVMKNLEKNNMASYYVETKEEIVPLVESLIGIGDVVSCGGGESLSQSGVLKMMRNGNYEFLDRGAKGLTDEDRNKIYSKSFSCDVFFCSANALTENGELYNVDGRANRIAALAFGPNKVICIVGENKIVSDLDSAVKRVKTIAAPLNAKRLHTKTPCAVTGVCCVPDGKMGTGCSSEERICCSFLVCGRQRIKNRINVIICGESLGY